MKLLSKVILPDAERFVFCVVKALLMAPSELCDNRGFANFVSSCDCRPF